MTTSTPRVIISISNEREVINMKIYLIMLGVAIVCRFIMLIDTKVYIDKHYTRIAETPFLEKLSSRIKDLFFILLIFPYIFSFLIIIFLNEYFLEGVDKALQNSEYYEEKC